MDKVDKKEKPNFDWLPIHMPGVTKLFREMRSKYGDAHMNECWRRGVLNKEEGWFFAREGSLAVGVPWEAPLLANFAAWNVTRTQALLIIKEPGAVSRGTH